MSKKNKLVVLVGGCFDILHPGHVIFLEEAKRAGDELIVLLESDKKIKKIKGLDRPIHTQKERALNLKALKSVDQVISLPYMETEEEYDNLIKKLKPDIIAATYGSPNLRHYKRTAAKVGVKLKYVTKFIGNYSTTKLANRQLLKKNV